MVSCYGNTKLIQPQWERIFNLIPESQLDENWKWMDPLPYRLKTGCLSPSVYACSSEWVLARSRRYSTRSFLWLFCSFPIGWVWDYSTYSCNLRESALMRTSKLCLLSCTLVINSVPDNSSCISNKYFRPSQEKSELLTSFLILPQSCLNPVHFIT